jgi:hypothetical protein
MRCPLVGGMNIWTSDLGVLVNLMGTAERSSNAVPDRLLLTRICHHPSLIGLWITTSPVPETY